MIYQTIEQMRAQAVKMTAMGTYNAVVWQQVQDIVIEVFADAADVEFVAKAGDEIYTTDSLRDFVGAIEYALDNIAF